MKMQPQDPRRRWNSRRERYDGFPIYAHGASTAAASTDSPREEDGHVLGPYETNYDIANGYPNEGREVIRPDSP